MTKICVWRESDWLVLVAMMLIYPTRPHILGGIQDQKQKYNLEWPNVVLYFMYTSKN